MTHQERFRKSLVLPLFLLGCAPTETELFSETQALLAEGTGESCDLQVGANETAFEDESSCENDLACVAVGESAAEIIGIEPFDGMCTCRCDGPVGLGPYCACQSGFQCAELIVDLGLGDGAYSFCVAE